MPRNCIGGLCSRGAEVIPRETRVKTTKLYCGSVGEVREGLHRCLGRDVNVRCLNTSHSGGKVRTRRGLDRKLMETRSHDAHRRHEPQTREGGAKDQAVLATRRLGEPAAGTVTLENESNTSDGKLRGRQRLQTKTPTPSFLTPREEPDAKMETMT